MIRTTITIMLLLVLLGACTPKAIDCHVGTQGIEAKFANEYFPARMNTQSMTPIIVNIENRGAQPDQVRVAINYNEDFFEITGANNATIDVFGKERWNNCQGSLQRVQFNLTPYQLPITTESFERPLSLDICYHYGTNFSTQLCIDPRSGSLNALDPNCEPGAKSFSGGQGAPFGIVKIGAPIAFIESGQTNVRIPVHARNFGSGEIMAAEQDNDFDAACMFSETTHRNYIYVKGFLDDIRLNCDVLGGQPLPADDAPRGKIFLRYDPERVEVRGEYETLRNYYFECLAEDLSIDEALTMTLDLEMAYYYRDTRSDERTTEVRKV